jgi:imidazolonepropionase-like amidohydrolase
MKHLLHLNFFASICSFVEGGIPTVDILRSLTIYSARLLGMEAQHGRLIEGMSADIISTEENPLDDIMTLKQVSFVTKEEKIIVNKY